MSTDDPIGRANGHEGPPGSILPTRRLDRSARAIRPMADGGIHFAGLAAQQARREAAAPGAWPRFLLKHAVLISLFAVAALAGAHLLLHSQTHAYKSQASVVVQPPGTQVGSQQAPDMATEKGIVSSNVVLTIASRALHVPTGDLFNGLSVTSPGSTFLLTIAYTDSNRYVAQQRAEAIAEAYIAYRTPKPVPASNGKKPTTTPVATTPTAILITPALLPVSPSSPKPTLDYSVALVVGLGLGIGTAAIRDRLDDRVRGPGDLEALAGVPLLALIPAFWRNRWKPASRLVMISSPGSIVANAYRDLRTRIVQATVTPTAKTVIVTSPAWEDRDAVAANLAVALAQAGRPTVLVCADLRWGRIHQLFGAENTEGLVGVLYQRTHLADAIIPTGVPALQVLPAGPTPFDTGAVLQRSAFYTLIGELRSRAEYIVIDAPPILASADGWPLADMADMILLVVDARRSARAQVRAGMRELAHVHGKFVGCALTSVGRRRFLRRYRTLAPFGNSGPADGSSGDGLSRASRLGGNGAGLTGARPAPPRDVQRTTTMAAGIREITREDDQ